MNKLVLFVTALLSLSVQAYNPGGVVAVNTTFIENHKGAIANIVIKILNTVNIPTITTPPDSGFDVLVDYNTYAIAPVHRDQVTVNYDEQNNAIIFKITGMTAKFHSDSV